MTKKEVLEIIAKSQISEEILAKLKEVLDRVADSENLSDAEIDEVMALLDLDIDLTKAEIKTHEDVAIAMDGFIGELKGAAKVAKIGVKQATKAAYDDAVDLVSSETVLDEK